MTEVQYDARSWGEGKEASSALPRSAQCAVTTCNITLYLKSGCTEQALMNALFFKAISEIKFT
jgi:hypothetical protein